VSVRESRSTRCQCVSEGISQYALSVCHDKPSPVQTCSYKLTSHKTEHVTMWDQ
ncbi:hypothetical protein BaRGS_00030646, partial [Batillaria attramentaria]